MSFACTTGEVIQEFALTAEHEFRHGAPYIRIHRADYHNLLAVRAPRIKPDVIHLDHRVVGFVEPIFFEPSIPRSGFDLFLGKFRRCEYLETVHSASSNPNFQLRARAAARSPMRCAARVGGETEVASGDWATDHG